MSYRLLIVLITIALFTSSCVQTANIKKIEKIDGNKVGVISLFTNEAKCYFGTGILADTVYTKDSGWELNKKIYSAIEQKINHSGDVLLIEFDLKSLDGKYQDKYKTLSEAIIGKYLENHQDTDIDLFLVLYPNPIDAWGKQYSSMMNFGLMGPLGVLLGGIGSDELYTPTINIYKPTGHERFMTGKKPACQLGYNLFAISKKSGQIVGQKENILCKEILESDFWPDSATSFEQLNLPYLKEKCLTGISKSISVSLDEIGL